jgi:hypothetical protein
MTNPKPPETSAMDTAAILASFLVTYGMQESDLVGMIAEDPSSAELLIAAGIKAALRGEQKEKA